MNKEKMYVSMFTNENYSLGDVIFDALDRDLGGYYDDDVMNTYFPDFDYRKCESGTELLITLMDMGTEAVQEGRLPLFRLLSRHYDIVLKKLPLDKGLTLDDMELLIEAIKGTEGVPLEISAKANKCFAVGFMTTEVADVLRMDFINERLRKYIASILDGEIKESVSCEYEFQGIKIWLSE